MTRWVYIVEGNDGTFYTGMTGNVRRRIEQHNGLSWWWDGAKYTKSRRPVFLVHLEKYSSWIEAHNREREIKGLSQTEKRELIGRTTKAEIISAI